MKKEFVDFFNRGYIKIFFIGRFYVLRDGYAEFFNVFRKRKEYFAIVEKMPLNGSEMSISEESGYWELEELIKLEKKTCVLMNYEISIIENTEDSLITSLFSMYKNECSIGLNENFFNIEWGTVEPEEFNNSLKNQY